MTSRYPKARTVSQVLDQSPALSKLTARLQASQQCLRAISPLIPAPMRKGVHAGPIEQIATENYHPVHSVNTPAPTTYWVLLADNVAVAAKLRQLHPLMLQSLEKAGFSIQEVRIQILPPNPY